jgi:hypothetical protein
MVVQLIDALHYKPEGRGLDSRWCHWNFLLTQSFRLHHGPEVDSAFNRNEHHGYLLGNIRVYTFFHDEKATNGTGTGTGTGTRAGTGAGIRTPHCRGFTITLS